MGYTTEFDGRFTLSPPLDERQISAVRKFEKTRHGGNMNPWMFGFWCSWTVTDDGRYLEWNEAEKFYSYVAWLHCLNQMFFTKWQVVMSGRITWQGEDDNDVGVITATPVTREDGIWTTEIKPPTGLLDTDIDDIVEEEEEEGENAFLIHPPLLDIFGRLEGKLKKFEESVSATDAVPAGTKWRWKVVGRHNNYLKWQGSNESHGCIHWLQQFNKLFLNDDTYDSHVMLGTVSLPGGLVITAKPVNKNGVCETEIKISSPLLDTGIYIDSLSEIDREDNKQNNCFAVFYSSFLLRSAWDDMKKFCDVCHGDEDASEPWIVPDSFYCGWKVRRGPCIVWKGGDNLQGCVHWLHLLDTSFFHSHGTFMVGKVTLPGGLVIEAEACRKGGFCITRITPKMPIYDFVREGNRVRLKEVDRTSWKVNWLMSCKGNCGWKLDRQQERPRRSELQQKCPSCGQHVLFTKKMVPPERGDVSPVHKRSRLEE